jgi:hypothetical protein
MRLVFLFCALIAGAAHADEFNSTSKSVTVGGGFEQGPYGEAIPAQVGVELKGFQTADDRQAIKQWQVGAGAKGGYGGNEHPAFWFAGGSLKLDGSYDRRFFRSNWSPIAGVAGKLDADAIAVLGRPLDEANKNNNLNGLAGINGVLAGRGNLGVSYINGRHSLYATTFLQIDGRSPGDLSQTKAFTEGGVHLQYDLASSFYAAVEVLGGVSPKTHDPIFSATDQASRFETDLALRKTIYKGWWAGIDAKIEGDGNKTTYAGSPIVYSTRNQLDAGAFLTVGIPVP